MRGRRAGGAGRAVEPGGRGRARGSRTARGGRATATPAGGRRPLARWAAWVRHGAITVSAWASCGRVPPRGPHHDGWPGGGSQAGGACASAEEGETETRKGGIGSGWGARPWDRTACKPSVHKTRATRRAIVVLYYCHCCVYCLSCCCP